MGIRQRQEQQQQQRQNQFESLDGGGFADLGGQFVYLALKDVADGEDSDETAIIFYHGEVAHDVVDHDGGGLGDGGGAGGHQDRSRHDFGDGNLVGVASAESDTGHDIALGEKAGDDSVLVNDG